MTTHAHPLHNHPDASLRAPCGAARDPGEPVNQLTAGQYLRLRREQADMTIVDVARYPHDDDSDVTEKVLEIATFENDVSTPTREQLEHMRFAFPFDPDVYAVLAAGGEARLCRVCGCSMFDPCDDEIHGSCAWAGPDLCTTCEPIQDATA